jgi:hypothetical protein
MNMVKIKNGGISKRERSESSGPNAELKCKKSFNSLNLFSYLKMLLMMRMKLTNLNPHLHLILLKLIFSQ